MSQYCCDKCGVPLERTVPDYYAINKSNGEDVDVYFDDDDYIGIAAVYHNSNGKACCDLCKKCTIEIAKEFLKLVDGK